MLYFPGVIRHFPFCAFRARVLYSIKKGTWAFFLVDLALRKWILPSYFRAEK